MVGLFTASCLSDVDFPLFKLETGFYFRHVPLIIKWCTLFSPNPICLKVESNGSVLKDTSEMIMETA